MYSQHLTYYSRGQHNLALRDRGRDEFVGLPTMFHLGFGSLSLQMRVSHPILKLLY